MTVCKHPQCPKGLSRLAAAVAARIAVSPPDLMRHHRRVVASGLAMLALTLGALDAFGTTVAGGPEAPLIAAASDLQFALDEIAEQFTADTGLTFGSSDTFARQIEQGAPFELYFSADEDFVFRLADGGYTRDRGVLYAVKRIVLFTPHASPLNTDEGLASVEAALEAGAIRRFAIANPEHAPYGRAAEQALRHFGLWERLQPHIVLGENVSQAAQFAVTGNSQGGIIAYSLALAPSVRELGRFRRTGTSRCASAWC